MQVTVLKIDQTFQLISSGRSAAGSCIYWQGHNFFGLVRSNVGAGQLYIVYKTAHTTILSDIIQNGQARGGGGDFGYCYSHTAKGRRSADVDGTEGWRRHSI